MVFLVVMYGCESWTVKKVEHRRIDAFELWCWWRLLRVPWTARRSNQSILREISPECSLDGMMLKLKCQYFCHLTWRADSFEKTLMLGGIGGRRRRGWQRMRWLDGITDSMDLSLGGLGNLWWTGRPGVLQSVGSQTVRHDWATELNWIFLKMHLFLAPFLSLWKLSYLPLQSASAKEITCSRILISGCDSRGTKTRATCLLATCVCIWNIHI